MTYTEILLVHNDGTTAYFSDGENYYGLNYAGMDKGWFREYAGVKAIGSYRDEDGDISYEYDDDWWDIDDDVILDYAQDYINKGGYIAEDGDEMDYQEEGLFYVVEGDNGWHDGLMKALTRRNKEKNG